MYEMWIDFSHNVDRFLTLQDEECVWSRSNLIETFILKCPDQDVLLTVIATFAQFILLRAFSHSKHTFGTPIVCAWSTVGHGMVWWHGVSRTFHRGLVPTHMSSAGKTLFFLQPRLWQCLAYCNQYSSHNEILSTNWSGTTCGRITGSAVIPLGRNLTLRSGSRPRDRNLCALRRNVLGFLNWHVKFIWNKPKKRSRWGTYLAPTCEKPRCLRLEIIWTPK